LDKYGIKYEDLNEVEKETYKQEVFRTQNLTMGDVIENVRYMRDAVSLQLCDEEDDSKAKILKARLKNYLLLEAFLTAPEKAQKALERQMEQRVK